MSNLIQPTTTRWIKITKTFADFNAPSNSITTTLFELKAKNVILQTLIVPVASFTGGTITLVTASVAASGGNSYAPAFNIFQSVTSTLQQLTGSSYGFETKTGTSDINVTLLTTLGNGADLTQGEVDFFFLVGAFE